MKRIQFPRRPAHSGNKSLQGVFVFSHPSRPQAKRITDLWQSMCTTLKCVTVVQPTVFRNFHDLADTFENTHWRFNVIHLSIADGVNENLLTGMRAKISPISGIQLNSLVGISCFLYGDSKNSSGNLFSRWILFGTSTAFTIGFALRCLRRM